MWLWCYCVCAAASSAEFLRSEAATTAERPLCCRQQRNALLTAQGSEALCCSFIWRYNRREKATGDNLDWAALSPRRRLFEEWHRFFQFDSRYFDPQLSTTEPYKVIRRSRVIDSLNIDHVEPMQTFSLHWILLWSPAHPQIWLTFPNALIFYSGWNLRPRDTLTAVLVLHLKNYDSSLWTPWTRTNLQCWRVRETFRKYAETEFTGLGMQNKPLLVIPTRLPITFLIIT